MRNSQHNLRRKRAHTPLYALIVCAILVTETACGSGASGSQSSQISSLISSVSVVCSPSTVATNATSQCNAAVQGTGTYSSAVTWSASGGNISASGLITAPPSPVTVTVTGTSVQDTSRSGAATVTVQLQTLPINHIVLVMEENQSYATVVGNTSDWPNLNNLMSNGALATNYYANSHPSIGNYFMLTTGQLLTTDDSSTTVWNVDNLARRMLSSGVSFKIYAEGITHGYLGGNTGLYLIRHNPFAMLSDVADNPQVANQCIWPFTQFAADLASGTLPDFSYIVPNVDDDAHNGTPQQADAWLQTNVVAALSNFSAFASGGDGILIVDFDEAADSDTTYGGGHVAAVFWGPSVNVGFTQTSTTVYQHQSMLRTVMEALQLSDPPAAAASAPSMSEFFVQK
ncbi:MAG: alkaline phosphatase family protein [Candidatus Sulfotelmatobacter sp.]